MIKLPTVTLIIVDCINQQGAEHAIKESTKHIEFAAVKFLTSLQPTGGIYYNILSIESIEQYSEFIFKKLADFIETDHCLVIQADGFVCNPAAWKDSWLNFDYIGAPWGHRADAVGNGGFSLRSLRLLKELQSPEYNDLHPEDDRICLKYGDILRAKGFNIAPTDIADEFSFEPNGYQKRITGPPFGFHGEYAFLELINQKKYYLPF